ncbi:thioredoxin fold domain-containing protein [Heterostelium album PN500]|uniref:Thioredoxin fold domain-containing protein n=1 Tax=Heterostelium pallidum (strain ATCC 26659 / Pp 5 / PN500) TaxID=670386 RepID=D3B9D4_HETP5|nr:thioredoxin fold domain-containing protein [Heterostelium album PN500]EFA81846.1 thioredoxin fold domain-containing protein [Heterostelium album PN500]|eukprot:XP_020433963.1 thioredoxin fold domain-containing protein [Heterostelium album PN500]
MAKQTLRITSTDQFESTVAQALATSDPVFVVFISTLNEDGIFWCPDCRVSDPVFKKAFDELENYCLVECAIQRDGYKGNPEHPYRTHPRIQLKGIPTLMSWKQDTQSKFAEDECGNFEKVSAFLKANL